MVSAVGKAVVGRLIHPLDAVDLHLVLQVLLEGIPLAVADAAVQEPLDKGRADVVVEAGLAVI